MKRVNKFFFVLLLLTGLVSCKRDFLDEVPESFLSTANAFRTEADFTASTNNLYGLVRSHYYTVNDFIPFFYQYRTDAFREMTVGTPNLAGEITPTGFVQFAWAPHYKIIAEANTIISRIPASQLTAAQKTAFEARARFFRAFGYRALAYLYGGVPLVLEEVATPKTDFTRATRAQVYAQVIQDLEFAMANLPSITAVADGQVSDLAAAHLLAEVANTAGQYQKAVDAATRVISNPNMGLMTARFGSRANENPGDVYWDMFRRGNQNRRSGNREAIWVAQIEIDVPGGAGSTAVGTAQNGVYALERVHAPLMREVRVKGANNVDIAPFIWPRSDLTGGRGVGFMAPSPYFINDIWQSDFDNDIRNANHNFVREFISTNADPRNPYFGQVISHRNPPAGISTVGGLGAIVANQPNRAFYPYQTKATHMGNHPTPLYENPNSTNPITKLVLKTSAGGTYRDEYIFRLAETYLLRAEAYLGLNRLTEAAADINVVRARAKANPVAPANVTIDYILDERIRELGVEEKRMLTLMRLGKWVDRVRRLHPFYGAHMRDHYNLWPIPASEIERNNGAVLDQNPGY